MHVHDTMTVETTDIVLRTSINVLFFEAFLWSPKADSYMEQISQAWRVLLCSAKQCKHSFSMFLLFRTGDCGRNGLARSLELCQHREHLIQLLSIAPVCPTLSMTALPHLPRLEELAHVSNGWKDRPRASKGAIWCHEMRWQTLQFQDSRSSLNQNLKENRCKNSPTKRKPTCFVPFAPFCRWPLKCDPVADFFHHSFEICGWSLLWQRTPFAVFRQNWQFVLKASFHKLSELTVFDQCEAFEKHLKRPRWKQLSSGQCPTEAEYLKAHVLLCALKLSPRPRLTEATPLKISPKTSWKRMLLSPKKTKAAFKRIILKHCL